MIRPLLPISYYGVLILLLLITPLSQASNDNKEWAITVYQAVLTPDHIEDVLVGSADYDHDYQLTAIALSKTLPVSHPDYQLESEIQYVKHTQGQNHSELNALIALRWLPFPWDNVLNTDFAIGLGLSYATEVPPFEVANHSDANDFLAYILLELEFRPQSWQHWSVVLRSHHRSGAFGLFNGVHGASNSLGFGVKYRF